MTATAAVCPHCHFEKPDGVTCAPETRTPRCTPPGFGNYRQDPAAYVCGDCGEEFDTPERYLRHTRDRICREV